ncbi:MAG: hypothetical protein HY902_21280 [Deltaproteobacteria bacterium]|nr:hypothetical protein [Deltaproteobacteria bacterium]
MKRLVWIAAAVALGGCGEESASGASSAGWYGFDSGSASKTDVTGGVDTASGGVATQDTNKPPEKEPEADFGAPEGSPNFVYIPAAGTDRIVRVAGATLQVTLIEVSSQPTVLKVVPGQDAAVVLHRGADEAAVIWSSGAGDTVQTVPVLAHCNALAIDPTGQYAVIWYNHAAAKTGDPVGSFQAMSVIKLGASGSSALSVSVGFRPQAVQFTADGQKAMVVTDDGVSVLELAKLSDGAIVTAIPLATKPLAKIDREVLITDDGQWAVMREAGLAQLTLVHLPSKTIALAPLGATPTDVDLIPAGKAALAVLRDAGQVAMIPLPDGATQTFAVQVAEMGDLVAGLARVTDDGKTALLYTSLAGVEQVATLDIKTGVVAPVAIRKTVDNVLLVPGTRKALLLHKPGPGPGYDDPTEKFVDDAQGYTLFDLDTGYTKLVLTPVHPLQVAPALTPAKARLLLPDPAGVNHLVQEADLTSFQTADTQLGSAPQHARFLTKAGLLAVTQDHPSGRITFIDAKTGTAKTVTGYELNGKVK